MKTTAVVMGMLLVAVSAASAQYQSNTFGNSNGSGLSGTGSNPSSHTVSPYTNSSGTTVQGSHATNPNHTQMDNYSTRGNVNPYTGAVGTRTPHY